MKNLGMDAWARDVIGNTNQCPYNSGPSYLIFTGVRETFFKIQYYDVFVVTQIIKKNKPLMFQHPRNSHKSSPALVVRSSPVRCCLQGPSGKSSPINPWHSAFWCKITLVYPLTVLHSIDCSVINSCLFWQISRRYNPMEKNVPNKAAKLIGE